jgi:cytochrome c oxidase subunit II
MLRHAIRTAAILAVVALAPFAAGPQATGSGAAAPSPTGPRVVEIVARRFQFTPNVVVLHRDEPAILRLRSEDVVHGFFQRVLGFDTTIEPGKVTDVPVTPREAGRFVVICHHFCGAGHGNMKLTVVVE